MDTAKINTLAQIHSAQDSIINAMADPTLSAVEVKTLQDASSKLRNMERSIVALAGQELVDSLTLDSKGLDNLIKQMNQAAGKLAGIAVGVKSAADIVASLINIITTATAAGLL